MRRFYRVSIALIAMLTIAALVWPATQTPVHYQPASTQAADIYSDYAPTGMTAVARRSRATSVYINVVKNNGFSGMASGTYGFRSHTFRGNITSKRNSFFEYLFIHASAIYKTIWFEKISPRAFQIQYTRSVEKFVLVGENEPFHAGPKSLTLS